MITTPYVLATLVAIGGSVQQVQLDQRVRATRELRNGDTEARVLAILGPPHNDWEHSHGVFGSGMGPRRWIYGTDIELKEVINLDGIVPNLLPFKLRIFGPYEGDLIIVWDEHGRVINVLRPPLEDWRLSPL